MVNVLYSVFSSAWKSNIKPKILEAMQFIAVMYFKFHKCLTIFPWNIPRWSPAHLCIGNLMPVTVINEVHWNRICWLAMWWVLCLSFDTMWHHIIMFYLWFSEFNVLSQFTEDSVIWQLQLYFVYPKIPVCVWKSVEALLLLLFRVR